ncbi:MAG: GntR family transcriptional regulator [Candidatus Kaistia colombiensis]|nr:MAG: GntR family transcriptional regulator [Kaistia sp.]
MSSVDDLDQEDMRLHAAVYKVVQDNIASGHLHAGMILRERALAEQFSVSRMPVARALRELADAGLIEHSPGRGFRVAGRVANEIEVAPPLAIPETMVELTRGRAGWEKIYQQAEHDLVAAMPFGRFKIIESGMADYYGVSRTVTGELLARLQERGLVERRGRSQTHVPALSADVMRDLYEVRIHLEPPALVSAAGFIPSADLEQMLDDLRAAEGAYPDVELDRIDAFEQGLHVAFLNFAPNRRLLAALRATQLPLLATNYLLKRYLGTPEEEPFLAEHRIIVELLLHRAPEAAAAALRSHLASSCEKGLQRIETVRSQHTPTLPPFLSPS